MFSKDFFGGDWWGGGMWREVLMTLLYLGILGSYNLIWNLKYKQMLASCTMYVSNINIYKV
jgi:hypothetical protein